MRISAADGTAVTLQPCGWEFLAGPDDDQWLVIDGHVILGDRAWSFTHPCLELGEAYDLARWLQAAADGNLQPAPAPQSPADDRPQLGFVEPLLGFSLARAHHASLLFRG